MEIEAGRKTISSLLEELGAVMKKIDAPIQDTITKELFTKISTIPYDMKSSMQRDMEKSLPLEAEHIPLKMEVIKPFSPVFYANIWLINRRVSLYYYVNFKYRKAKR